MKFRVCNCMEYISSCYLWRKECSLFDHLALNHTNIHTSLEFCLLRDKNAFQPMMGFYGVTVGLLFILNIKHIYYLTLIRNSRIDT